MRPVPYHRMITSWSIPEANDGNPLANFPPLDELIHGNNGEAETLAAIKEWNGRLAALEDFKGSDTLQVMAGGYAEVQLSPKGSLGLW